MKKRIAEKILLRWGGKYLQFSRKGKHYHATPSELKAYTIYRKFHKHDKISLLFGFHRTRDNNDLYIALPG